MKKFLLIILFGLIGFSTQAQGIDFGIKAGMNFATLSDASGLDNKTGFVFGGFAGIKFSKKLGIQADLLYSQQGAESNLGDIDLDYVNVPIVLRYFLIGGLNLQVGPQFGFVTNSDFPTENDSKNFDTSGVVGLGYDLPLGLRVEGRYIFGFSEVAEIGDSKNQVFTLAVGYSFL